LYKFKITAKDLFLKSLEQGIFSLHSSSYFAVLGIPKPKRIAKSRRKNLFFMKRIDLDLPGLESLTKEEKSAIVAGESLWFWVGYTIGSFVNSLTGLASGGQRL
jgi:hypothetical protein